MERLFVGRDAAYALRNEIVRFVALDALHELAFIRRLRTLLGQGREPLALQQIADTGRLSADEARAFLDRSRDAIAAGKIPQR